MTTETGADDYVGKPYDTGYVIARGRELLARRSQPVPDDRPLVLVIDDSPTYRAELQHALEAAGYAVATAATGEHGLFVAGAHPPAAILVDGVLPGIDGATVIRRIRLDASLRGVPCVLLTASDERDAEIRALDSGADAFVRKTEDVEMVLARLAAVRRSAHATSDASATLVRPKRILAVDDSLPYLHALAAILRGEGYEVVLAHSGEEAIEMLAAQPVDCILLDLVMPGLSGTETCSRIKSSPVARDIPLLMLSAMEEREAMIQGLAAGADDYIPKSGDFELLNARLRAQLRRKQFEDENRKIREELLQRQIEATEARVVREVGEARRRAGGGARTQEPGARDVQLLGVPRPARAAAQHRWLQLYPFRPPAGRRFAKGSSRSRSARSRPRSCPDRWAPTSFRGSQTAKARRLPGRRTPSRLRSRCGMGELTPVGARSSGRGGDRVTLSTARPCG